MTGVYDERILPRLIDVACGGPQLMPMRQRACAGLVGEVIEIGFGSGHNVPLYPPAVDRVAAIEPADLAWRLAAGRVTASRVPIERSGLDGQLLPYPDHSFDAALSTMTLCTIPEASAALRELRRVLEPGGTFHFLEHGLAPDEPVRRWQHRFEPLQRRMFGGCHLTRPILDLITGAGFVITEVDVCYLPGAPKFGSAMSLGVARSE